PAVRRRPAPRRPSRPPAVPGQAAVLHPARVDLVHRGVGQRPEELRPEPRLRLRREARGGLAGSVTVAYWLLVLPALLMMVGFYVYPLSRVLWISVSEPAPGLANYALLFSSAPIQRILLTTARICTI